MASLAQGLFFFAIGALLLGLGAWGVFVSGGSFTGAPALGRAGVVGATLIGLGAIGGLVIASGWGITPRWRYPRVAGEIDLQVAEGSTEVDVFRKSQEPYRSPAAYVSLVPLHRRGTAWFWITRRADANALASSRATESSFASLEASCLANTSSRSGGNQVVLWAETAVPTNSSAGIRVRLRVRMDPMIRPACAVHTGV
jgi:hypothetical protein